MTKQDSGVIVTTLTGTRPMLLSNAAGAYPQGKEGDKMREINAKRVLTENDIKERDWLKYKFALYIDENGPYIPGDNLWACCRDAAAKHRLKTAWIQGATILEDKLPIILKGLPKTAEEMYNDPRYVDRRPGRLPGGQIIMVVRPSIPAGWKIRATIMVDDAAISVKNAIRAITIAGKTTGIGTFRQRFGRFEASFE